MVSIHHVYHAFHHILTIKKPRSTTRISQNPLKKACKSGAKPLDHHFQNFSQNYIYREASWVGTGSASNCSTISVTSCIRAS
jgi:hypothetical protein